MITTCTIDALVVSKQVNFTIKTFTRNKLYFPGPKLTSSAIVKDRAIGTTRAIGPAFRMTITESQACIIIYLITSETDIHVPFLRREEF